jgi:pyruvate ferredoxin oxidoreductase delta subunit
MLNTDEQIKTAESRQNRAILNCDSCNICILICPDLAITKNDNNIIEIDHDFCKGCGLCAHYCPERKIKMVSNKPIIQKH